MSKKQTLGFQTEVKQMLNLVINSLYSNKEIFLRELISNASDALDKLRFLALSDSTLLAENPDLNIKIEFNEKLRTLSVIDNGIGLNKEDAINNLGTIAKSGTKEFFGKLTGDSKKDSHLIGQFGVGFYSAFMVADKIEVRSRKAGQELGVVWESEGSGEYSVSEEKIAQRGTAVILHIKEGEDILSDWKIRNIVNKYSDHICWPILMQKPVEQVEDDKAEDDKANSEPKKTAAKPEFEAVNKATALWTQQKSEVSADDYKALYKHISHDYQEPLLWSHNHVEGKQHYISLLYIPTKAPFDMWQQESKHGLKLYVKRVFIMDDAVQFLPRYLRFVKGIVDASDLPLNISREILQENKQIDSIRAACTKRVLSMLEKLADNDAEKYQKFWDEFGLVLKEGPVEDMTNKDKIAKLLRFASTENSNDKQNVSLADYIKRMQDKQDKIYYITASSYNAAKNSPHLEIFRKKGIEVLLLSDKIDEWLVGYLSDLDGKKLQSISKGKVDLGDIKEEDTKEQEKKLEPILKQIEEVLKDKVKKVQVTNRLTNSPVCIVSDDQDMGLEMQRILQQAGQEVPKTKPIFEINPDHGLIIQLHDIQDDEKFEQWVTMLFEQAVLAEGGQLDNPADFINRVNNLLATANI